MPDFDFTMVGVLLQPPPSRMALVPRLRLLLASATFALLAVPIYLVRSLSAAVGSQTALQPTMRIGRPLGNTLHICVATEQWPPLGLLGVINSTLTHAVDHGALIFHIVAPPELHAQLAVLQSLFPELTLRIFGMATNDVEGKIRARVRGLMHATTGVQEDLVKAFDPPLYEWAVVYLPQLFPQLRRLIWLDTDTIVRTDLQPLWRQPLHGLPLGAVMDCAHRVESAVNTSQLKMLRTPHLAPRGCGFDKGVLLVDLVQWAAMDATARVEYWLAQYVRTTPFVASGAQLFKIDRLAPSPHTPMMLALGGSWLALHPRWNLFDASGPPLGTLTTQIWEHAWAKEKFVRSTRDGGNATEEVDDERDPWREEPRADGSAVDGSSAKRSVPTLAMLSADARGHILHFSWRGHRPWDKRTKSAAAPQPQLCASPAAFSGPPPALRPCHEMWSDVAEHSVVSLGWDHAGASTVVLNKAWDPILGREPRSHAHDADAKKKKDAKDAKDGKSTSKARSATPPSKSESKKAVAKKQEKHEPSKQEKQSPKKDKDAKKAKEKHKSDDDDGKKDTKRAKEKHKSDDDDEGKTHKDAKKGKEKHKPADDDDGKSHKDAKKSKEKHKSGAADAGKEKDAKEPKEKHAASALEPGVDANDEAGAAKLAARDEADGEMWEAHLSAKAAAGVAQVQAHLKAKAAAARAPWLRVLLEQR